MLMVKKQALALASGGVAKTKGASGSRCAQAPASALPISALPLRHVTRIRQDQPEFLIAQVLFGKAGHPLPGPNSNRARISDQRAQTGIREVFRRVHWQIQIGAKRRRSCPVHRMAALGRQLPLGKPTTASAAREVIRLARRTRSLGRASGAR
jgi:hypothetical protein